MRHHHMCDCNQCDMKKVDGFVEAVSSLDETEREKLARCFLAVARRVKNNDAASLKRGLLDLLSVFKPASSGLEKQLRSSLADPSNPPKANK
jgi:hypothetical protein